MMNNKILHTIEQHNMINKGDKIIVALSGGSDSMALLFFLNSIKSDYDLDLLALHVNHSIRGISADNDELFVKNWCSENLINFNSVKYDVPKIAKNQGISTELCGRNLRYEFFNSFGKQYKIATAHNLNDCIETTVMNMVRGTSLNGLCGIPPVRDNIIRPLIDCTKTEIENYCHENNIPYVVDETNFENEYTRNVVRNSIVPIFSSLNVSYESAFKRMFENNTADAEFLNKIANEELVKSQLNVEYLRKLEKPILYRVITRFFQSETNIFLEKKHIEAIEKIIFSGGRVQVLNDKIVYVFKGKLRIENEKIQSECKIINKIIIPYEDFINSLDFYKNNFDFYADCDKIVGDVILRSRLSGDSITLQKRGCTKSLKKYFNEMAICADKRNCIPILADDDGVVAVVGYDVDSHVIINNTTKKVLLLKIGG